MTKQGFVVFSLGSEEFGIEIAYVQELMPLPEKITKVFGTPDFMEGIINIRGRAISLVNLRKKLSVKDSCKKTKGSILVLTMDDALFGIMVDSVSEVIEIDEGSVQNLTCNSSGSGSINRVGKIGDRLILLFDASTIRNELIPADYDRSLV